MNPNLFTPSGDDLVKEEDFKSRYFKDGKIRVADIAKDVIDTMHLVTMIDNEDILYYENGIYHQDGDKKVKELLIRKMGLYLSTHNVKEILAQIQARTYIHRDKMNGEKNLIHLINGIYNIETDEFLDFTPDIYSTNKLPILYDKNATCPTIDKFLDDVLPKGNKVVILELFGYCLYRNYQFQTAFMFVGGGSNGKSTLLNLFIKFVGMENISNKSLQTINEDRFASSDLYGKMTNLFADLPNKGLKFTGIFKLLTGGDPVDAQRKFKPPFKFINYAKLIFSCNELPYTTDQSDAFFRRWIILDFPNKFEGQKDDKKMIDKISTPAELSGLFNLAYINLKNLLRANQFSFSESTKSTKEKYMRLSNSIMSFAMDCLEPEQKSWITKEDLYNAYCKYCREYDLSTQDKSMIGRTLPNIMTINEEKKGAKGDRKMSWVGVKFKKVADTVDEDKNTPPSLKEGGLDDFILSDDIEPEDIESDEQDDYVRRFVK